MSRNSAAFFNAQEELKQFGLWLEDFEAWLGEKPPYKYIVMSLKGAHVAYANTIAGVRKALAKEKRILAGREQPPRVAQLSIFD